MKNTSQLLSALMTLVIGILFIVLKGSVISVCLTILGVVLLVLGIVEIVRKYYVTGVIKAILGAGVLVVGWVLLEIAVLVVGAVLALYGIVDIFKAIVAFFKNKEQKMIAKIFNFIAPILCIVAAVFLLTSKGEAYDWAIVVAGVFFVIDGFFALIGALADGKKPAPKVIKGEATEITED